eukprot:6685259-Prorocentrum_lima.AAC.1
MTSSLVGSEMCIRDRLNVIQALQQGDHGQWFGCGERVWLNVFLGWPADAVSYTHLTLPTICSV